MKKLTTTQQKLLDYVRNSVDEARALSFEEWYTKKQCHGDEETAKRHFTNGCADWAKKYHKEARNGIVCIGCDSRTMWALANAGLIEIVKDSTGARVGVDKVKLLNH